MNGSTVFFLLLVLACPLMMFWMMRGGHGHGGHAARHVHGDQPELSRESDLHGSSTEELRRRRDELERLIEERESEESERELIRTGR